MFFERLGRGLLSRIRPLVFCCALALPPLLAAVLVLGAWGRAEETQEHLLRRLKTARGALERKARMDAFWARYANPAPYFLDKELEALCFLQQELAMLSAWQHHPALSQRAAVRERLQLLESGENRLVFAEEGTQISSTCKETLEVQRRAVEMDGDDLAAVLHKIENPSGQTERPQLVLTELHIARKKTALQHDVFEIQMRLLKREFL